MPTTSDWNRPFRIHDREDSADLMNLVRHELGSQGEAGSRPRARVSRSTREPSRTRFIPASILTHFQQTAWPKVDAATSNGRASRNRVDLGARMRDMWK